MNHRKTLHYHCLMIAATALMLVLGDVPFAHCQQPAASPSANDKPYLMEWVYKVKWGHADEFWQIFKKYQIPLLNREKELGYVTSYTIYKQGHHTGEDTRWEYCIVVTYKNQASSGHGSEITKELFPDQATRKREENRRWELVEAHYDLPIRAIDPNGDGE